MALIFKNPDGTYATRCALCNQPLSDPIFASAHFIKDKSHEFFRYSDAAMHWNCYTGWQHRPRFANMFFQSRIVQSQDLEWKKRWPILLQTPTALVRYGIAPKEISIVLKKSGTDLRISRFEWEKWLSTTWQTKCRPSLEHDALAEILPALTQITLP